MMIKWISKCQTSFALPNNEQAEVTWNRIYISLSLLEPLSSLQSPRRHLQRASKVLDQSIPQCPIQQEHKAINPFLKNYRNINNYELMCFKLVTNINISKIREVAVVLLAKKYIYYNYVLLMWSLPDWGSRSWWQLGLTQKAKEVQMQSSCSSYKREIYNAKIC